MDLSFFTRRYVDHSKNAGFQFEFFCDRCNKGYMTPFRIHALGVVTSIWDATDWKKEKEKDFDFDTLKKDVSKLFLKGKAWIEAYTNAVEEAQKHFKHCSRCLKWVCPKSCFNQRANLCQGCAPLTAAEKAALDAEERRKTTGKRTQDAVDPPRACPHCGKSNPIATFCADCGQKVAQDIFCSSCGSKWSTEKKMKFCPRCGDEMPAFVPRPPKPASAKSESDTKGESGSKPNNGGGTGARSEKTSDRTDRSSAKSDRTFGGEKPGDRTIEAFNDLSNEVRKYAEEYKSFAEDIFGLKPRKREEFNSARRPDSEPNPQSKVKAAPESKAQSQSVDKPESKAEQKPEPKAEPNPEPKAEQKPEPGPKPVSATASKRNLENGSEEEVDLSAEKTSGKTSQTGKSKPATRKVTKVTKVTKKTKAKPAAQKTNATTKPKAKSAPTAKKKVTKTNDPKGQSKPKAKKKPKSKS